MGLGRQVDRLDLGHHAHLLVVDVPVEVGVGRRLPLLVVVVADGTCHGKSAVHPTVKEISASPLDPVDFWHV